MSEILSKSGCQFAVFLMALLALAIPARGSRSPAADSASIADIEGRDWYAGNYYFANKSQTFGPGGVKRKYWPHVSFENGLIEGTPGCGAFSGTYARSGATLGISAAWADDAKAPCNAEDRKVARLILDSLANVRGIAVPPSYWGSGLFLVDSTGEPEIGLSPKQTGADLSEFEDTFWHLAQLDGSDSDFSDVVIDIDADGITFSTPAYDVSFPFQYDLKGLEFHPAYAHGTRGGQLEASRGRTLAIRLEKALHEIAFYRSRRDDLVFFDKAEKPVLVLSRLVQKGIENRVWRIARYRDDVASRSDADGLAEAREHADITLSNGNVVGSPGCGAWAGSYTLSGDKLTVLAGVLLAGVCSKEEEAQSDVVAKDFGGELRIVEGEGKILLRDASGKARILLVPY